MLLRDQGMVKAAEIGIGGREVEKGEVHGPREEANKIREEEVSNKGTEGSDRVVLRRALWRVDSFKSLLDLNRALILEAYKNGSGSIRWITPNIIKPIIGSIRGKEAARCYLSLTKSA